MRASSDAQRMLFFTVRVRQANGNTIAAQQKWVDLEEGRYQGMQLVERVGFCHGTMLLQSTHVIIQLCKYGYRVCVCVERCSTSFRGVSASYSRGPEPMSFQMRMNPVYFPFLQQRVGDVSEASGNHQYKTNEAAFPIGGYGNELLHSTISNCGTIRSSHNPLFYSASIAK